MGVVVSKDVPRSIDAFGTNLFLALARNQSFLFLVNSATVSSHEGFCCGWSKKMFLVGLMTLVLGWMAFSPSLSTSPRSPNPSPSPPTPPKPRPLAPGASVCGCLLAAGAFVFVRRSGGGRGLCETTQANTPPHRPSHTIDLVNSFNLFTVLFGSRSTGVDLLGGFSRSVWVYPQWFSRRGGTITISKVYITVGFGVSKNI